jgi:hypothetical protein
MAYELYDILSFDIHLKLSIYVRSTPSNSAPYQIFGISLLTPPTSISPPVSRYCMTITVS